jgi:hypothetical protein
VSAARETTRAAGPQEEEGVSCEEDEGVGREEDGEGRPRGRRGRVTGATKTSKPPPPAAASPSGEQARARETLELDDGGGS